MEQNEFNEEEYAYDSSYDYGSRDSGDAQQSKLILAFSAILLITAFGVLYLAYDALSKKFQEVEQLEVSVRTIGEEAIKQAVMDSKAQVKAQLEGITKDINAVKSSQLTHADLESLRKGLEGKINDSNNVIEERLNDFSSLIQKQEEMIKEVGASGTVLREIEVTASSPSPIQEEVISEPTQKDSGIDWLSGVSGKFYVSQLASTKNINYLEKVKATTCFKDSQVVSLTNGRYILVSKPYESFSEASKVYVSGELKSCNITPWVRSVASIRKILK